MKVPFPVDLDVQRTMSVEQLREEVLAHALKKDDEVLLPSFLDWLEEGRVCYRLEHDLLEALMLSDVPEDIVLVPPHRCMWIDLEGQTDFLLQGEPLAGFWLRPTFSVPDSGSEADDGEWVVVATTKRLADGSNNTLWFFIVDNGKRDRLLTEEERFIAHQLRQLGAMVTFYLMDPAHEAEDRALEPDILWTRRMERNGVNGPRAAARKVRLRVLGGKYRLPADAYEGTGRRLAVRTPVRGHVRLQRIGPGRTEVRATWVRPHWRGPADGPGAPAVATVKKPKVPSLTEEQRRLRVIEAMRRRPR